MKTLSALLEQLNAWLYGGPNPVAVAAAPNYRRLRQLVGQCPDDLSAVPTDAEIRAFAALLIDHTPMDRQPLIQAIATLGQLAGRCRQFAKMNANTILYQLLIRLVDPNRIDQGRLGLCGTVTSQLPYLASSPLQFARLAAGLLVDGCLALPGQSPRVVPAEILDADPADSLPQADWLVLASIRAAPAWQAREVLIDQDRRGGYGSADADTLFELCQRQYNNCVLLKINDGAAPRFHPSRARCQLSYPESMRQERGRVVQVRRRRLEILIDCLNAGCMVMLEGYGSLSEAARDSNLNRLKPVGTSHWVLLEWCQIHAGFPTTVSLRIRTWTKVYSLENALLDDVLALLWSAIVVPPLDNAVDVLQGV